MKESTDIKKIIAYLEGSMTEEEREEMEVNSWMDPKLDQEIRTMRTLMEGIRSSGSKSSKEEKIARLKKYPRPQALSDLPPKHRTLTLLNTRKTIFYVASIAAGLALLISIFILNPAPSTPRQLYAAYFEVSPNVGSRSVRSETDLPATWEAYQAYDQQDYALAATLFENNLEDSNQRITDLYHLGNCYLVLERWEEAVQAFSTVIEADHLLSPEAKWYLALAYLQTDNEAKSRELFAEVRYAADHSREAEKILKKLE